MTYSAMKRLLCLGCAAVALLAAASSGGAFEMSGSPAGEVEMPSEGYFEFSGGSLTLRCRITLSGRLLAGPIALVRGSRIGEITRVRVDSTSCIGGFAGGGLSLPWPMTINSTPAGLPGSMTSIEVSINGAKLLFSQFGGLINCLYEGSLPATIPMTSVARNTYRTGSMSLLTNSMRLISGALCPSTGSARAVFLVRPVNTYVVI